MKYTFYLLSTIFVVFLFQIIIDNFTSIFSLIPKKVFEGELWRIVTSIFLHADFFHLFFNSFALLMFGPILENTIGNKRFLIVFFISGILGNFAYLLTSFVVNDLGTPALGASGAIYGVIGTLAILKPTTIVFVYFIPVPLLFLAIFWIFTESLGTILQLFGAKTSIAYQAHLAGLLFGIFYGYRLKESGIKIRYYY
ncbi:MAG: rhomboid family intramembrane serine protease [Candidatus Aenigmatarchaeota archaeon]